MKMTKYVIKRIVLMFFTLFVISTICFVLIRILPRELPVEKNLAEVIQARWEALGYNEPLLTQFWIYLKNIFTEWDWGTSWYIQVREPAWDLLTGRLLPTVMVNFFSLIEQIGLQPDDELYVLGDVIDRYPDGIKILQWLQRFIKIYPLSTKRKSQN